MLKSTAVVNMVLLENYRPSRIPAYIVYIVASVWNFKWLGTIHKVRMLLGWGTVSRQKFTSVIFYHVIPLFKSIQGGVGIWKLPNLRVLTLWMVPSALQELHKLPSKFKTVYISLSVVCYINNLAIYTSYNKHVWEYD